MRTDSTNYQIARNLNAKSPRYAIKIEFDSGDNTKDRWFTSQADGLYGATGSVDLNTIRNISGTSQKLNPIEARATIGSISFDLVDVAEVVSTELNAQLVAGNGARLKTVELYIGDETLNTFNDYALFQTQLIKSLSYKDGVYSFKCSDIQRETKKNLFELKDCRLKATIDKDDGYDSSGNKVTFTITVDSTTGFETVAHGTSYEDAPSSTVGYIKIQDEVIRYTGTTSTQFTGCTRAVLGTVAQEHEYKTGAEDDQQITISEYVYLEMPAAKMVYALLTGSLINQGGATLPDHWHCGVSGSFVQQSSFTGLDSDIYDSTDDDEGIQAKFEGLEKVEGKKFIEQELLRLLGAILPVRANGALYIKLMKGVLSGAAWSAQFNENNTVSYSDLTHDMEEIRNQYRVRWGWNDVLGRYTRTSIFIDGNSITTHGEAEVEDLEFRGLAASKFTAPTVGRRIDALRSRYAAPPLRMSVTTFFKYNHMEVGDIVNVKLDQVRDYTGSISSINRAFEIQNIKVDWTSGKVTLDLFGSSQRASFIDHDNAASALPDAFYTATGTDISGLGGYSGGTLTGATLTGNADATAAGAIYYHDGDLILAGTTTLSSNVQIRVKGVLTYNGPVVGDGGGLPGTSPTATFVEQEPAGSTGGIGNAQSEGRFRRVDGGENYYVESDNPSPVAAGDTPVLDFYDLVVSGNDLLGLPTDLRGSGGGAGQWATYFSDNSKGGAGGAGGAGLITITRGTVMGVSGSISLDGVDGSLGTNTAVGVIDLIGGTGGGGSGGGYLSLIDGTANADLESIADNSILHGDTPRNTTGSGLVIYTEERGIGAFDQTDANFSEQYLYSLQSPVEDKTDVPPEVVTAISVSEFTDTPKTAKADQSTLEITVTPPSDTNYKWSFVEWTTDTVEPKSWTRIEEPAAPTTTLVRDSDGTTYYFRAVSVSFDKIKVPFGSVTLPSETISPQLASITITNITAPPVTEDLSAYQIPNVTGLELKGQGNDLVFVGKDAQFRWRNVSITQFYDVDQEPLGLGADAGTLDLYFKDYQVTIKNGATVLRTEYTKNPWFDYTYEMNAEDYLKVNSTEGAYRSITCVVVMRVQFSSAVSPRAASITVSNPAPSVPTVTTSSDYQSCYFTIPYPADRDWAGVRIWVKSTNDINTATDAASFDDRASEAIVTTDVTGTALSPNTTYYYTLAIYDDFDRSDNDVKATGSFTTSAEIANVQLNTVELTSAINTGDLDQQIKISPSGDGEIHVYGDRGDGTSEEIVSIGIKTEGSDLYVLDIGSANLERQAIRVRTKDYGVGSTAVGISSDAEFNIVSTNTGGGQAGLFISDGQTSLFARTSGTDSGDKGFYADSSAATANITYGIEAETNSTNADAAAIYGHNANAGYAVLGDNTGAGVGVYGESATGLGGKFNNNDSTASGSAPLQIVASASASAPSHTAPLGSLWVTSAGVLYINTDGSTTWQKVGAQ